VARPWEDAGMSEWDHLWLVWPALVALSWLVAWAITRWVDR
jgi:hypothetical protein